MSDKKPGTNFRRDNTDEWEATQDATKQAAYQEAVRLKICKYLENQGAIGAIEESCDPVDFILASHNSINEDRQRLHDDINLGIKQLKESEVAVNKWKKRALAFQEGYRNSQFENTAKEIQLMCLRAEGVDKVTAQTNEHLRVKLHAMAIERNELKEKLQALDRVWKEIKGALQDAMSEISAYKTAQILKTNHTTPQEKMDKWLRLVK